jgi:hypothetical protein
MKSRNRRVKKDGIASMSTSQPPGIGPSAERAKNIDSV